MLLTFTDAVYGKTIWIDHAHIAVVVDVELPLHAGYDECIVHVAGGHADGWRLRHRADYVVRRVEEVIFYLMDAANGRIAADVPF
jgi:hypothetical protein